MAAAAKYVPSDGPDADRPARVNAEAGRTCVQKIHQAPILSVEWLALVDSMRQLARLVQLECCMPANTKVSESLGRDTESAGTLWDQEACENAIRILVEEAKVNMCLRLMNDFKRWQYDGRLQDSMSQAMTLYSMTEPQLEQKCQQFEESLGLLLQRAFQHVETLQLMDIPLFIEHCSMVLHQAYTSPKGYARWTQEITVLYYFSSLMKYAEALNNRELLAKSHELSLIHLAVHQTLTLQLEHPMETFIAVAEGFSALADNEEFSAGWEAYFIDEAAKIKFLSLEDKVVGPVLAAYPDRKKDIRPMLDFFNTIKRSLK